MTNPRHYEILIVTIPQDPEDDDPGDERTTLESWEDEGTWSHICQHGANIDDCPRCNPFEA